MLARASDREVSIALSVMDAMMSELGTDARRAIGSAFVRKYANESSLPGAPDLTPVQWRILRYTADGLTGGECAAKVGIADKTVFTHKKRIREALGARNSVEMIARAFRMGML